MPTANQIRTLQVARRKVKMDEPRYRTLLRNVAGVESCKDLDNSSLEDVMAVLEDEADDHNVRLSDHLPADYWRRKVQLRGTHAGERMVHRIRELHAQQDRYPLEALVRQHSAHRTDQVSQLHPREAWKLIEMLKAVTERESRRAPVPAPAAVEEELPF